MSDNISKKRVAKSFAWNLLEKFGSQGLQFILSVYLARLLLPEDYGIIALIQVFIQIANVFVIDGFNSALIQKKDSDEIDFSTVFYLTSVIAVILYLIMFFSAPSIANFYKQPLLIPVVRIFSLSLFYTPLQSCQYAYISKYLLFKIYFIRSFVCLIVSGIVAIYMAKNNYGVYSLVAQQLVYGVLNTLIVGFFIKWHPILRFSFSRLKSLFSFGWKFIATGLLENIFKNIYSLIIGKAYNVSQLSFYNRGQHFPKLFADNFGNALRNVLFPSFSSKNEDLDKVKSMLRRSCQVNTFILYPLLFGMLAVAKPMILLLLTEKWKDAIPFLQLCCIYFIFYNTNLANMSAINALGKSGVFLRFEILKKIITLIVLAITIPFGVLYLVAGQVFTGLISLLLNMIPSKKYLNYTYKEQFSDIKGAFLGSAFMALIVYLENFIPINNLSKLILQVFTGIGLYLAISILFKINGYTYVINMIKEKRNNQKKDC